MEKSMYTVVEADELAEMHMLMWATIEVSIPFLFKDMKESQKYSFTGRDNRTYTISYKDKIKDHGTTDTKGDSK